MARLHTNTYLQLLVIPNDFSVLSDGVRVAGYFPLFIKKSKMLIPGLLPLSALIVYCVEDFLDLWSWDVDLLSARIASGFWVTPFLAYLCLLKFFFLKIVLDATLSFQLGSALRLLFHMLLDYSLFGVGILFSFSSAILSSRLRGGSSLSKSNSGIYLEVLIGLIIE